MVKPLPTSLLESLKTIAGFDQDSFIAVHASQEQVTSIRINASKFSMAKSEFLIQEKIPWTRSGYYLAERPSFTFDPLFHAGCYYVQEASSMFLEQALMQLVDLAEPLKVLDLCAAPGGKSTHIQSLIAAESLLVSNEIIKARSNVLIDNIMKWGCNNVIVTNNDPSAFKALQGYFDVMVVDAPCSGSGLFRKDEEAIDEWSLNNVQLCCQRQQRILADSLPALKENGILIYSTCSYSREEDEDIADWLVNELEMENVELSIEDEWSIVTSISEKTNSKGYRFYPDKIKGEGFFLSCFRKSSGEGSNKKSRIAKPETASAKEKSIIHPWLKQSNLEIIKGRALYHAIPVSLVADYSFINTVLNVRYFGVGIGQIMKDKLVPEHSLALSTIISDKIPVNELSYEEAIKYLQRQDFNFNSSGKGWGLVSYKGYSLGWVNVLANRINNYYPKELRILKQTRD